MQDHTKLHVWQRAHALTVEIFRATGENSSRRASGITLQLRRAVASIGANIAEGSGYDTPAQFARFLSIAIASANEATNHVALIHDAGLLPADRSCTWIKDLDVIRAMLLTLLKRVREREADALRKFSNGDQSSRR
jgi:four helix bundle protein